MHSLRVLIVASIMVMRVGGEEVAPSTNCNIPAIYNFGDSNSDTGGIAAAFFPMATPCGETFFHRPVGRASDGRLIIDFIAEHLGLPHLSAYLDSIGTSFRQGANFATGGATIMRQNESWFENNVSPFALDIQVEHFDQFKTRTAYFYNNGSETSTLPRPEDFAKAIYIIDIGQNDIAAGFRKMMSNEQIIASIPDIVNQLASSVQQLYEKGGRVFWIHSTGPIGCLPVATVDVHDPVRGYLDQQGCVKYQNDIAVEFNKQLKDIVIKLRAQLLNASLTYVDMYTAKYQLITNAKNQGFEEAFKICCGIHGNGSSVWCGQRAKINGSEIYGGSCEDPSKVISWDGVHYSESANHWIANYIVNGSLSDPPIPIVQACHKL
ncbi:hypothetical protein LguiA_019641 [Lonicera macranthoides]